MAAFPAGFSPITPASTVTLLADNGTTNGTITIAGILNQFPITVVTSGASYTVGATDNIVIINKSVGSATAITLPSSPVTGRYVTLKDGKGDSAINNITISPATGLIDGSASIILNNNYSSVLLTYNGTAWNVL